ncbi:hypothetical protein Musp01_08310 [Muricauda sp. NBRC 101325]|nr:hypothetical protein Musp01_08310 [Muricauda sp. NBRC 101325]
MDAYKRKIENKNNKQILMPFEIFFVNNKMVMISCKIAPFEKVINIPNINSAANQLRLFLELKRSFLK